ncbi:MAG TPA: hypothetical protein VLG50_06155 [Candidatus Saccharimonadales bacterium]|nr:hypothetical protein [Candidatus Saccharimonadales bacterium]
MQQRLFDNHCASEHVASAFKEPIENKKTSIVSKGRVRLFGNDQ